MVVTTRSNVFTQHETVREDGTPVNVNEASGSGANDVVVEEEQREEELAVVVGVGRGRGGGGRGRGRGPAPVQMVIGEDQVTRLLGGLHRPDDFSKCTKNFSLYGGKRFDGRGGAVKAKTWLDTCDEVLARMVLTLVQRRDLVTQHLDDAALHWWRAIKVGLDLTTFTYEEFVARFREKFVPSAERDRLCSLFLNLK